MDGQNNDKSVGYILVKVMTGKGKYPVEGATVTVIDDAEDKSDIIAVTYTDNSGMIEKIPVSAGSSSIMLPGYIPQKYTVEVYKEGFFEVIKYDVPVLPEYTTIQEIHLVPEQEIFNINVVNNENDNLHTGG